ncbi:MAG: 2-amino-4-hydroxy-6-hydroxymethyldihydropteridine diphosphokinase [Kangiellaceae bacterium]|nr:2-amino-4-hydroxy-6-hydroxymethyldihydropteridine diphosphokinase [Kangiellaceae bacterium]
MSLHNTMADIRTQAVYVGLGANQANPQQQIRQAVLALQKLPNSKLELSSSTYRSAPMGPQDQDDYLNAVAKLSTSLSPDSMLDELLRIEQTQGRVRKKERWGPRTLDLDILLFGNLTLDTTRLTIPHYGIKQRSFVLLPII